MIRATGQTKTKCTKYTVCVLVLNMFTFSSVVQYTHAWSAVTMLRRRYFWKQLFCKAV